MTDNEIIDTYKDKTKIYFVGMKKKLNHIYKIDLMIVTL